MTSGDFGSSSERTWAEDLVQYFRDLGGEAHYSDLYKHIEANPRRALGKEWQAVVRRTIEEHSSDTTVWPKRRLPDLFYSVDGLGGGKWALREMHMQPFPLQPGEQIRRKALHDRFGGSTQGGISASSQTANVFLFSDPEAGEEYGYFDGWNDDGYFHYTGSGQHGDQRINYAPNAAILNHREGNRALRLFRGSRDVVTYVGRFEVDADQPYFWDYLPERTGGPKRWVVVFRLHQIGDVSPSMNVDALMQPVEPSVTEVPIEKQHIQSMVVNPKSMATLADRKEASLVLRFAEWAEAHHFTVFRNRIVAGRGAGPFLTDVYIKDFHLLIEAKGSSDRVAFRMAIGQLVDYRRFMKKPRCAILLPTEPDLDILQLAKDESIGVIWPLKDDFRAPFDLW